MTPVSTSLVGRVRALRLLRGIAASVICAGLLLTSVSPVKADELDDRRSELSTRIIEQSEAIEHASDELTAAHASLEAALDELRVAEADLEAAEAARDEAQRLDDQRAEELAEAEHRQKQAEADVAAAQAAFDAVDARTNEEIVVITQQNGSLVNLALLVTDVTAAELNQRAQLSTTLFDSSALELDELQSRRFALDAAKAQAEDARTAATAARQVAATQLADTVEKEAAADAQRRSVSEKVAAKDSAADEASRQLDLERSRQDALEAEAVEVEKRIAERIAAQKAAEEAAAKKAAEEAAAKKRAEEAAAKKAAEAAAAKKAADEAAAKAVRAEAKAETATASKPTTPAAPKVQAPAPKPQAPVVKKPAVTTSSSLFQRPVTGRLTSPYGMRLHPVLRVRKLHDGTDFAAACNSPIRAAAAGTVAERYYNAGYGNRLMLDHGKLNGKYVTTGYNHANRYTVSVGQKVSKGEVIGYVGSTGYSTGCHMHLMVWENGGKVNPMSKWFR